MADLTNKGDVEVRDDYRTFEAQHVTLVASTNTPITFSTEVVLVRVINWDPSNRILVKDGIILSDTDSTATRIGKAPAADIPNKGLYPFKTDSINIRSAAASEVTVEGYVRE